MKKILLLLLLSVSYFSSAQSTYSIAKALQLQTVNESTSKSDSVLVRGEDKIVKFVPRSEFGGGIPLINEVLRSNPFDNQTDKTLRFFGDLVSGTYNKQLWISPQSLITYDPVLQLSSSIFPQSFYVSSGGSTPKQWGFNVNGFEFFGKNIVGESQFYANINFPVVTTADTGRVLPLSVNNEYADANGNINISAASLSDINVQQLMDNSSRHGSLDSHSTQFDLFTGSPYERSFKVSTSNLGGTIQEGISFQSGYYEMFGLYTDEFSNVLNSRFKLTNGEPVITRNSNYNGDVNIGVAPDLGAGDYKISVAVTYINSTTVDKTQTELYDEYPLSRTGDKVQCMDIVPTPKIYERTQYGWAEYTVTVVAP
jgi:hypothetical protein